MAQFKKISRRFPVCTIASENISNVLKHKVWFAQKKRGTPTANKSTDLTRNRSSSPREHTPREISSKSHQIKQKPDPIHRPPTDLEPNEWPFGSKSIGKW